MSRPTERDRLWGEIRQLADHVAKLEARWSPRFTEDCSFTCEKCGPAEPDDLGDCTKCQGDLTARPIERRSASAGHGMVLHDELRPQGPAEPSGSPGQCKSWCGTGEVPPLGDRVFVYEFAADKPLGWYCTATCRDKATKPAEPGRPLSEHECHSDLRCSVCERRYAAALEARLSDAERERDEATERERARCLAWISDHSISHLEAARCIRSGAPAPTSGGET